MRPRILALALLAGAAALHLMVTVPLQRQAGAHGDEYRRLRDERRQVQTRLARWHRAESLHRQAATVFTAGGSGDVVRLVRRSVVDSLEGSPVSGVRISVRPGGREQVAAALTLNAEGEFDDVVRLASHVVRTGSGLVLQSVLFSPRPSVVGLSLEAFGPRSSS
jgi:hypothetical protein